MSAQSRAMRVLKDLPTTYTLSPKAECLFISTPGHGCYISYDGILHADDPISYVKEHVSSQPYGGVPCAS